jgi:uncharacterized protein (TIGR03083 family)
MNTGIELLVAAWGPIITLADGLDDDRGWTPTNLPGWTVRDLIFHLASDAQRGLVALFTPAKDSENETLVVDEVDYWRAWQPGTDGAQAGLRSTRAISSQWASVRGPVTLFTETARAAMRAARAVDPNDRVETQGYVLTVDALLRTLAVEAAVHHLDLEPVLPERPADLVLHEVRRVLDLLLGQAVPSAWDDVRWARLGTGRALPDENERAYLGSRVRQLPLFG